MKIRDPVKISFGYNKNSGVSKGWVDSILLGLTFQTQYMELAHQTAPVGEGKYSLCEGIVTQGAVDIYS
jgi:hypothetical protein